MKFDKGDVVSKKVGGPLMTVELTRTDGLVSCQWFNDGHLHRDCFDPNTLNKWELVQDELV